MSVGRRFVAAALTALAILGPASQAAAQEGGNSETPSAQHKLTKLPKLVRFVKAPYPESEKKAGKTASVTLQIAIDDKGHVEDAIVVQSAGKAFDDAALQAARQFKFTPAEIDNKPAPVKITYRYDFVMKKEPKQPVVNYEGMVKNRFSKKPIPGVKVEIAGVGEATTDAQGHFKFKEVPLGKHVITISGPGLTTVSTEETLEKGKKLTVKYALEPKEEAPPGEESDLEIVVVAPKIQKEVVSTEIKAAEGRRVPGTQGDTLKVVQNLPGVARASFGSGQLVVWGASPQDTRVYVDGVHIPLLYHGGGLRSTINSDLVRAIELSPGGYGAEYGGGLGGLVTIDTRTLRTDRVHGYVAADVIDASAMVEAPVTKDTRVAVAGRKSYLDRTLKLFTSKDVTDFIPIPNYYDAQLKVTHDLGQNESLVLFGLIARDTLTRRVEDPDPAQIKTQDTLTAFNRIALTYKRQMKDGSSVFVTPWGGHDHHAHAVVVRRHAGRARRAGQRVWAQQRVARQGRQEQRGHGRPRRSRQAATRSRAGVRSRCRRARATSRVFGQPPGDQVNADSWQTTLASIAPYAQVGYRARQRQAPRDARAAHRAPT